MPVFNEKRVMDILLDVLTERSKVPNRALPVLSPKQPIQPIRMQYDRWVEENLMRDVEGDLDWAGLISAELYGALQEPASATRAKRLITVMAYLVAAVEQEKVGGMP